jgi:hypothetical protein
MRKLFTLLTIISATVFTFAIPRETSADGVVRTPRVRASDARTAVLLTQGLQRSETIRALVNRLERRDVIVYIEIQPALKKRLAGTLTWMTSTVSHRYVRISINPELNTEMAISTLGHELQHALEVANAPEVVSDNALEKFYRVHGDSNRAQVNGWDTEAARVAGEDVRRELAATRSARVADSIQQFDPDGWLVVYRRARSMLPP